MAIGADGRLVAFESGAAHPVPDDTDGRLDVFVRDPRAGRTRRVGVADDGARAEGRATGPALDARGRTALFSSEAPGLVPRDTHGAYDAFVRRVRRAGRGSPTRTRA
ncbi:hypothetical protein LRS74_09375 [Streptomyces sp. LX-29]|uniref:hypothetical protein n=1 Tax=Streptomyces sp. LX-29 TaxID=2900152 RepID=UPI00240D2F4B|nr:hypothetical protein [Streptomyces sp. LX-29]WFB07235.1 hypothetical protein LRS74_09375 [Streptomyces sp. LX-29]